MARQVKGSGLDVGNNSLQNVFNNIVNDTKDVPPVAEVKTEKPDTFFIVNPYPLRVPPA